MKLSNHSRYTLYISLLTFFTISFFNNCSGLQEVNFEDQGSTEDTPQSPEEIGNIHSGLIEDLLDFYDTIDLDPNSTSLGTSIRCQKNQLSQMADADAAGYTDANNQIQDYLTGVFLQSELYNEPESFARILLETRPYMIAHVTRSYSCNDDEITQGKDLSLCTGNYQVNGQDTQRVIEKETKTTPFWDPNYPSDPPAQDFTCQLLCHQFSYDEGEQLFSRTESEITSGANSFLYFKAYWAKYGSDYKTPAPTAEEPNPEQDNMRTLALPVSEMNQFVYHFNILQSQRLISTHKTTPGVCPNSVLQGDSLAEITEDSRVNCSPPYNQNSQGECLNYCYLTNPSDQSTWQDTTDPVRAEEYLRLIQEDVLRYGDVIHYKVGKCSNYL